MSSELLRKAAALMRERADEAAPTLPWVHDPGNNHLGVPGLDMRNPVQDTAGYKPVGGWKPAVTMIPFEAIDHVRSWHPFMAVLVAGWLDDVADEGWCCEECKYDPENENASALSALAVARAYLESE